MDRPDNIDKPNECSWEAAIMRALHERHNNEPLDGDFGIFGAAIELIECLKVEIVELKSQLNVQSAKGNSDDK